MRHHAKILIASVALTSMALLATVTSSMADRYDALRSDAEIENGVLIVAIGDLIRDNCPTFEDRRVASLPFLIRLARRAESLGYSRAEIEAYVDDDAEKARVEARARQWFLQMGADFDTPETVCQIARDEIAAGSTIGRLIRER